MKIGLVQVDGHIGKKKWGSTAYPNLALGKIARYWVGQGAEVTWAVPMEHYDKLYMSKVFNFTPDDLSYYDADEIIKGGTGYDVHSTLPDYIDRLQPLYSIFDVPKNTAYGFLTRGCPNTCPWCVVPKKEGAIHPYMDIDEIAIEGRNHVVLMDNNILAAGDYAIRQLEKIRDKGYVIDFNQALDARLVTDDIAKLLASVKWMYSNRIRFGCDTHAQIKQCEIAINRIKKHGFNGQFFLYTMIGGVIIFASAMSALCTGGGNCRTQERIRTDAMFIAMRSHTATPYIPATTYQCGRKTSRNGQTKNSYSLRYHSSYSFQERTLPASGI